MVAFGSSALRGDRGATAREPRGWVGFVPAAPPSSSPRTRRPYRSAMIGEQSFEGRKENLNQANKLSRTYVTLLEALNRHRGKGIQQRVTVEHVHVHSGGQALVGAVQAGGVGGPQSKATPCKSPCPCTCRPAAERGPGARARADRRRCRTADAACTAARRQGRLRVRGTEPTGTAGSPVRRSSAGGS